MKLPIARTADLVEQNTEKELLIYDLQSNKAFMLNETSRNVFHACVKEGSFADLKREHQYTDEMIYLALDGLKKNNLISGDYDSPFAGMNRREIIRKIGLASMLALPVVSVLVAPYAANAASGCIPPGGRGEFQQVSCPTLPDCSTFCAGKCCSGTAGPTSRIRTGGTFTVNCQC